MLPISLLQSQLAHNKKRINELQFSINRIKSRIYSLNQKIIDNDGEMYLRALKKDRGECFWEIKKTRKQLKQLAILQKEIKQTIQTMSYYQARGKKLMFVTSKL